MAPEFTLPLIDGAMPKPRSTNHGDSLLAGVWAPAGDVPMINKRTVTAGDTNTRMRELLLRSPVSQTRAITVVSCVARSGVRGQQHQVPDDATSGQIAIGRYVLQIGEPHGAAIRHGSRAERAHIRPRATPILMRPRLIRALFGRQLETDAALAAIDAGIPIEVSGEAGIGKTALL